MLQPTNPSHFGQLCCQLQSRAMRHLVKLTKKKKKRSSLENDHQNIAFLYSVDNEERFCTHKYID